MNENLKKLYDSLSSKGYYTKSFEDFQQQYQDPAYQDKVFGIVTRDGLYTKDKESFIAKYSASGAPMEQPTLKKKDTTASPSGVGSLASSESVEEDYFQGAFGQVLKGFDNIVPIGIGDFVDDIARSVAAGYRQGNVAEEADNLLLAGAKATPEEIQKFIEANKSAAQLGQSKEMQDYMKTYESEGKGFWGVVKGLVTNPTVIPEVLTSSLTSLATNADALKAGAAAVGTGTLYGAGTGAAAGGVGAVPGAAAGAVASIPYAFGLASSVVEAGSTFGELLQEELGGEEMTKENVKALLENPEKLQQIRNKAITRGMVIGTADAFTGKLASSVGAKILTKSAAKSATGAATKGAVTAATAAGAGVEAVGGSLGEAAARGAIGQEMDVSEIALEGIAELPGGIRSTIQARLAKPEYKVNGAVATKEQIDDLIETMSPEDLAKTNIEIKNDYDGRQYKIQEKITDNSIKEQIKQANPELNEPSLNAIVELEKQLRQLEGNTTQTGKDKSAAIRAQIKDIQENQLQQEAEAQTLKTEQDAIQEQTAGQVPVQPTAGVSEAVEGGTPQAEPQVTAKEGEAKAEEVTPQREKVFTFDKSGNVIEAEVLSKGEGTLSILFDGKQAIRTNEEVFASEQEARREAEKETIGNYNPATEEIADKNNEVLGLVLNKKKIQPDAEPEITDLGDSLVYEYANLGDGTVQARLTFKKNESGEITAKGVKIEKNTGRIRDTDLFKNFVESQQKPVRSVDEEVSMLESMLEQEEQPAAAGPQLLGVEIGPSAVVASDAAAMRTVQSRNKADARKSSVLKMASKAVKTLKSVFPDMDIVLHDDSDSYNSVLSNLGVEGRDSKGTFNYGRDKDGKIVGGRIDIDMSSADAVTVAHEVAHAVLLKSFGDSSAVFKDFRNRISKILSDSTLKELNDFASQYGDTESHEEFIVQFAGLLSNEGAKIPESAIRKIAAVINDVVSKLTGGAIKPFEGAVKTQEVIDFLNTMSNAIGKGEAMKVKGGKVKSGAATTIQSKASIKDIDVNKIRTLDRAGKRVSKGLAVRVSDKQKVVEEAEDLSLKYVKEKAPQVFIKNAEFISKYPIVQGVRKFDKITNINEAQEVYDIFTRQIADNLKFLMDKFKKEFRDVSTLWYDGANILAQNFSKKYGVSIEQASGIIASLSPQKDWYQNVRLAEMVMMAFKENPVMTNEMVKKQEDIIKIGLEPYTKELNKAKAAYKKSRSKANAERVKKEIKSLSDYTEKSKKVLDALTKLVGTDMSSVSPQFKSFYIRLFHEVNTTKDYDILSPDGNIIGVAKKGDGTNARVAWGSYTEIGKAVSIYLDGSQGNITRTLGEMHKIRNFYNNIVDPMSPDGDVTMDTHAVAAALLLPLSGNTTQVKANFGTGTANSSPLGIKGLYYAYAEGYDLAAKEAGLLPRQVQSITWEAIRGLFTDSFKKDRRKISEINDIVDNYANNKITIDEARTQITESAGGIKDPSWAGGPLQEGPSGDAEGESDGQGSGGDGLSTLRTEKRREGRVASKAQVKEGEEKYRVAVVFKGRRGGYTAKNYEFNNKQHFSNWMKKYATKFGVKDFYELNTKAQLSKVRGAEKVVELGRGSGFSDEAIRTVLEKKGYTQAEIDRALKAKSAASSIAVDADFVQDYDAMMEAIDERILEGLDNGEDNNTTLAGVLKVAEKSDAYKKATDQQREQITRDVKEAFGEKIKAAPSAKKLLGFIKDVKNITMTEMSLLKKQFSDMASGSKTARVAISNATKALVASLKELRNGGFITDKQMITVLRKFSKTNVLDPASIEKFVEYMTKVFNNAEYAEKISKALSLIKQAKKNIRTKIGISEQLYPLLNRMFSINPSLIPDAVFDKYMGLLEMFAQKGKVINLANKQDVTDMAREINDAIDEEISLSEELAIRFDEYQDKVFDKDGKLDYAATVQAMLDDDTITEEEAKLMKKYKSKISPAAQKEKKTDAELEQERQDLITAVDGVDIDTENLPTHDEREVARKIERLIKTDAIKDMTIEQLTNLLKVIDNISNGYLPHYAQLMLEKLNAINNGATLARAIENAKPLSLTRVYANLKRIFTRKEAITEMVRRSPLAYIDQLFGNFKTKDIFDSLFKAAAEAQTLFRSNVNKIQNMLDEAQTAVARSFNNDPNKTLMSKFKMMTYLVQLEYQSNPNSKQVNAAAEHLKATIKHIDEGKSSFGERDANMLQEILDTYSENGEIDIDKLYKSFNPAERNAIKTIREINDSLVEKAVHTSAIIRGDKINLLENYVHLNVLHESQPDDAISGVSSAAAYNNSLMPSTKAKSLISRTGKVTPLNFDVFASAQRGANFILMDYYLTEPIRTARKTINEATAIMEKGGRIPKEKRQILNAIASAFEESTENLLNNVFITNSFADDVANYLSKSGYRAVLASAPRFISELTSNISFALFTDPKALSSGFKYKDIVMSSDAVKILNNLGSKQTSRIFPHEALAGRLIDSSIMSQASGIKGGRAKGDVANVIQMLYNNSVKKYKNSVEALADALISTPDKIVMRPLWIGSFANEFKRITGEDIDFEKVAANDEAYMLENKDALDDARDIADQRSVLTGATDNAYMDILKGKVKHDQSALARAFNVFNNYMTRFAIYEYSAARTGIMAAMGNGSLSRKQGVALMAGVTSRMMLYTLLASSLGSGMVDLFTGDDEEEEDEKSLGKKVGQALTSTFTSLLIGRDFGNATKTFVNYGLERFNEKYLDNLREGDYDPYKDAIQYTVVPPDTKGKQSDLNDFLMNMGGPFGPALKTANLVARKLTEEPKKQEDAIERSEKEVKVRIPLEVLGNVGLIPMYKDVRKVVMKNIYKDLDKAEKASEVKQDDFKPYGLNKTELKKYMPEVYDQYFGEGTSYEEQRKQKAKLRKKKDELRKKILDEKYDYISGGKKRPKTQEFGGSGFGSKKFGEE